MRRAKLHAVYVLLVLGCASRSAPRSAEPMTDAAPAGDALAEDSGVDQVEHELARLEAQLRELGVVLGPSSDGDDQALAGADEGQTIEAASRTGDRCQRICGLAEATCDLHDRICSLADAHDGEPRYAAACERADDDCRRASEACRACTQ